MAITRRATASDRERLLADGLDLGELCDSVDVHGPAFLPLGIDAVKARFTLYYAGFPTGRYTVAVLGDVTRPDPVLLRVESACAFGHLFGSLQCDCGWQWRTSLRTVIEAGRGVLIYAVDQDARGAGMAAHFDIYQLRQQEDLDTDQVFERIGAAWDSRDYTPVPQLLRALGVRSVALMSNNAARIALLINAGFEVARAPLEAELTVENMSTLMLEKEDLGYAWSFATHADVLEPLQAAVADRPQTVAATLAEPGTLPDEHVEAGWDDIAQQVRALAARVPPGSRQVLYLTDLPRLADLDGYSGLGVRTLVVPYPHLPPLLTEAGTRAGIRVVDWSRRNAWVHERPQWAPVAADDTRHCYERVSADLQPADPPDARIYSRTGDEWTLSG
jgi:GTP cyclohydrolase II